MCSRQFIKRLSNFQDSLIVQHNCTGCPGAVVSLPVLSETKGYCERYSKFKICVYDIQHINYDIKIHIKMSTTILFCFSA